MCDDRLIFQVGEQSVHIVAERSKAVFLQVFFGDIQIAAGHKNKDQDGDSCAKPVSYTHLDGYKRQALQLM